MAGEGGFFIGNRDDFRDETIYFLITTRFYDGDPSNNTYCWDGTLNQAAHDPEWRGDFRGLIEKLDYIKALGFTAVWITPIVENASGLDYHGYHAFDFSKVDPRYESDDVSFQTVIDEAHSRGMKIILDIVLNHTGNFGEANLCPMFYKDYSENLGDINASLKVLPGGRLDTFVGEDTYNSNVNNQYQWRLALMKNTDGVNHDTHNYWHHYAEFNWDEYNRWYGQIAGDCVDLNTENPYVAQYLVDCYGEFIKMGVDGFRIDTSGHIPRVTFNNAFIPQFQDLAAQYEDKRTDGNAFFMFGEVCARYTDAIYRGQKNLSPFYYTWKEGTNSETDYGSNWRANSSADTSWDNIVVMEGGLGDHVNMNATVSQGDGASNQNNLPNSSNVLLNSGDIYHEPDYSSFSGLSVIDFTMHWMFDSAEKAFGVKSEDKYYNDASYNVVYVDSHDYAPDNQQNVRFNYDESVWAENLDLMFTFRGIPCLYYGSEIQFKKGCVIDNGANTALINSGRAYFGGYIKGDVHVTDFGEWDSATGNMLYTLSHPLADHIQRLNRIRAAVPALRKGQYSTNNISGSGIYFKRRYTKGDTDSYALVVISGSATFSNLALSGRWVNIITGDVQTGNSVTASATGKGQMAVYVYEGEQLFDTDGKYLFANSSTNTQQGSLDGTEEEVDYDTPLPNGSSTEEPDEPITPSLALGEQAIFFDDSASSWGGPIYAWVWENGTHNYTVAGSWPGDKCEYLGNKVWKWTYAESDTIAEGSGCVFSNSGSPQTVPDFDYVNGGYYNVNGLVKVIEEGSSGIHTTTINTSTDDAIYTLQGIKVEGTPRRGVYIKGGRKVVLF